MPLKFDQIELQLCQPRPAAFDDAGWLWEPKMDGFRLLAGKAGGKVHLQLRRGRDATHLFPEITSAFEAVKHEDFIVDGELVIQDQNGKPIFQELLKRSTLTSKHEIAMLAEALPAVYFAFDLLSLDGKDLRELPVRDRKKLLFQLMPKDGRLRALDHVEGMGTALLEACRQKGLEGVVGKKATAPYRGGRGADWVKVAFTHVWDFAVVGYAAELGALHLGVFDGEKFVYAGKVGAGFGPKQQKENEARLKALTVRQPACAGPYPDDNDVVWCKPELVVEVRYKNWPQGLNPREPVLLRFRDDKAPEECIVRGAILAEQESTEGAPPPESDAGASEVKLSNPAKLYFPEDKITKEQVFEYYRAVSPWLLPYLKDRPLMLTRFPDGIHGKSFFQKGKPARAPAWVRSIHVRNEEEQRDIDQIVCDDLRTLEWVANMGTLPLHLPSSRVSSIGNPDWCVIDFDPKEAPFERVIELALGLHELLEQAKVEHYVKTSGSSGLHVMLPLGAQTDHHFAQGLAQLLAQLLVQRFPKIATIERVVKQREGKVYVDFGQNGQGRLIAAPFCVRPKPKAPVSMPLAWAEVKPGLSPRSFTIKDAVARLKKKGDLMAPLLTSKPDLSGVLQRLAALG